MECHPNAAPVPTRELFWRSSRGIRWPKRKLFVVLGDSPPSLPGARRYAAHIVTEFAAGQFQSRADIHWLCRHHWDHLIWLGDTLTQRAQVAPSYYAVALGHEFEHAHIAELSLATTALEIVVEMAARRASLAVPYEEFPHEIWCDLAGLRHGVSVYSKSGLAEDLARIRGEDSRIDRLLSLLEADLGPPADLHEELMQFVERYSLRAQIRVCPDSAENAELAAYLDRSAFE